jgi:hypothetical protein
MIVLAIVGFIGAIVWTALAIGANAMSDSVSGGFQFGGTIVVAWIIEAILILAWWLK